MGLNKDILILGLNVEWTSGPPLTAKTNIVEANSPNYSESSVLLGIHCIILTKKYVYCWAFKKHIFKSKFLTIWIISNFFFHIWYLLFPQECHYQISLPSNFTIKFACDDFSLQVLNRSRQFTLLPNNYFY